MMNYNTNYMYKPEQFIEYWNNEKIVSLSERVFSDSSMKGLANRYYRGSFDIEKILYDPELKYIGIGTM